MPDFTDFKNVSAKNSKSVTLFPDGVRSNGIESVIFDTKQAEKIYYFRDYSVSLDNTPTSITSQTGTGTVVSDLANMGDGDSVTKGTIFTTDIAEVIIRFNFGSQSSRTLFMMAQIILTGLSVTYQSRFAGSDLIFSTPQTQNISSSKLNVALQFGTQDLQYVEIIMTSSTGSDRSVDIYGLFDIESNGGDSSMEIQVQNSITGNWFTVDSFVTIDSVDNATLELIETKTDIQPNNSLTRILLINTGLWTGSVGVLLVNPLKIPEGL